MSASDVFWRHSFMWSVDSRPSVLLHPSGGHNYLTRCHLQMFLKPKLSLLVHHSFLHHHSLGSIHLKLLSCWVESTPPFAARDIDSRPSVLLHPSAGHNCLTRCRLQMFLKQHICVEYGNRTREHQSGHQSSYTNVLNFSDLTRLVLHTTKW